jgi:CHAT domain
MSCAVACADSIHQGQFDELASYSSPIIFNNTCWSWSEVAAFFLACGARAYIGTLWNIDNDAAVLAARTFYENLFSGTVLSAFHKAAKAIDGTSSKGIYIYWGLPFATLPTGTGHERAQKEIRKELMRAVETWVRKIESTKNAEVRRGCLRVVRLLFRELLSHFPSADSTELERTVQNRVPDLRRAVIPAESEEPSEPSARRSLERPVELRQMLEATEPQFDSHTGESPNRL